MEVDYVKLNIFVAICDVDISCACACVRVCVRACVRACVSLIDYLDFLSVNVHNYEF